MVRLLRAERNIDLFRIDGVLAVDRILHYEHLIEHLRSIATKIDVDISARLPRAKSHFRPFGKTADVVLPVWARWFIRQRWKAEFESFGYRG